MAYDFKLDPVVVMDAVPVDALLRSAAHAAVLALEAHRNDQQRG